VLPAPPEPVPDLNQRLAVPGDPIPHRVLERPRRRSANTTGPVRHRQRRQLVGDRPGYDVGFERFVMLLPLRHQGWVVLPDGHAHVLPRRERLHH
jgi:hypothetical protein